ncbi:alpha-tocopherol transfer protein-related [Holotrichia oblita]|uniref:Alpha-tocopherol transfer protein-related n=1 Tax=Holotrichia oblita TaxID=644536 RepID=A0ACB9TGS7_HOLOL|nr:alpha-tocopherol transfer protein-related [Holotrichia oblita]
MSTNKLILAFIFLSIILPLRTTEGPDTPRIILARSGLQDPSRFNPMNLLSVHSMLTDIMINEDDQNAIAGLVVIQDYKGITLSQMTQMTPALAKKASTIFQEAIPARIKQAHYMNVPTFFDTLFQIIKPFMKEKLLKRMVIHTSDDPESIYKYIPKEVLPEEYGGKGDKIQELTDYWKEKIESYKDWFVDDLKYKSIESKRRGKPKTHGDVFGLEGAFRKLDVD